MRNLIIEREGEDANGKGIPLCAAERHKRESLYTESTCISSLLSTVLSRF